MIGLLGLNHKTAPIKVREKFVFCEEDVKRFVPQLIDAGINGAIVVSTCNRTEIYFDYPEKDIFDCTSTLAKMLFDWRKADKSVGAHFYHKFQDEASQHLFRVASGLDSMALGEYQIVGQLKDAFAIADKYELHTPTLIRLFNKAFEAGKKVRTETALSKGAVSISYAAVELANKKLHNLSSHPTLLLGAGQTGELTLQNLLKKGCNKFTIINRTAEKAQELAKRYKGVAREFSELQNELVHNDIVVTSTASKKPLITKEMVEQVMIERQHKPMFFVDLSVPHNVAPDVAEIENVFVNDIDDLNAVVDKTFDIRKGEIEKAEAIIAEFVTDFSDWQHTRNLTPTFQSISDNFRKINEAELEGFIKRQSKDNTEEASMYADHITNKFIRLMIKNVKSITDNGRKKEYIELVNDLFKLAP
ncbi:glutamyl-tRNA reductase [Draconibacterium sediminis]|uniref:glutamyl-tRNA reductase n=1 Tax=Draconibacterium sediminis TaxID=1544798 RepID=UPI000698B89D|nr:glutamyl-tRNA reductase [Draconibacterium sediminis]